MISSIMKIVPILKCRDVQRSITFYTGTLDFTVASIYSTDDGRFHYCRIVRQDAEIHLSTFPGDGVFGTDVYLYVEEVDTLFNLYRGRGLGNRTKPDSPVHQGLVDQTWGMREFYVDDPDGNTLRFGERLPLSK
jgi:catechol 2,3-dioxygenase-like lactoylglutathione lyase family enzyme